MIDILGSHVSMANPKTFLYRKKNGEEKLVFVSNLGAKKARDSPLRLRSTT